MPQTPKEIYFNSIKAKQAAGLQDVKFYVGNTFNRTEDQIYSELNRMDAAEDVEDREVLGNRSPA